MPKLSSSSHGFFAQACRYRLSLNAACHHHIFKHIQRRQKLGLLKHKAVFLLPHRGKPVFRQMRHALVLNAYFPFGGLQNQPHDGQQGCFAAARGAGDDGKLAGKNRQIGRIQHAANLPAVGKIPRDAFKLKNGLQHLI